MTAATAALAAALSGVGTADAVFAALFGSSQIPYDTADNRQQNYDDDNIYHKQYPYLLRVYSALIFLLVLMIIPATTHAMTRIAASPASAAPMFREPPVTIVPMV